MYVLCMEKREHTHAGGYRLYVCPFGLLEDQDPPKTFTAVVVGLLFCFKLYCHLVLGEKQLNIQMHTVIATTKPMVLHCLEKVLLFSNYMHALHSCKSVQ